MRQAIFQQQTHVRHIRAALEKGAGDAGALRALAIVLAENLDLTLSALNEVDNAPAKRGYDFMSGGRPFSGVNSGSVGNAIVRVCQRLRHLPALEKPKSTPPTPPQEPASATLEMAQALRDLATDMDQAIAEHRERMPGYGDATSVPYIIEYQLNRRDVGEEPRLLRRVADHVETLQQAVDAGTTTKQ